MTQNKIMVYLLILVLSACTFKEDSNPVTSDPTVPNSPTPSNGSINQPLALTLGWKAEGAEEYDVYFDTQNPPTRLVASNLLKTNHSVVGLNYNTTYFWKVVAKSGGSVVSQSPVWSFSTIPSNSTGEDGVSLILYEISTELPSVVNVLFQATDANGIGIDNLTANDFILYENGMPLTSESNVVLRKRDQNDFTIKTVLLIDNSTSLSGYINELKAAASSFVNNIIPVQQEVAIVKFSEDPEVIQDFTNDKGLLNAAINSIGIGFPTTNLYGSTIEAVGMWEDILTSEQVSNGALVIFTDGTETSNKRTFTEALTAIGNKKVYTVGLGNEIDPQVLQALGRTGGFYSVADVNDLTSAFIEVGNQLYKYANSFYWLRYTSPKRKSSTGNNTHTLRIQLRENIDPDKPYIEGTFSSANFFSASPGLFVNSSANTPEGVTRVTMARNSSLLLEAVSYLQPNDPKYEWVSLNPTMVTVEPIENVDNRVYIKSYNSLGSTKVVVRDSNNNLTREVTVEIIP